MTFHTFIFWSKWAQEPGFTPVPPWRENDGETWRTQKRSADWSGKQTQAEKNFLVPWRSNFYHQVMIVGYCKSCWSKGTHSLLNIFFGFPFQVWIWLWNSSFTVLTPWPFLWAFAWPGTEEDCCGCDDSRGSQGLRLSNSIFQPRALCNIPDECL